MAKLEKVYILGGYQTDFARNWSKEGKTIQALMHEGMDGAFAATDIDPGDVESIHVGNFAGELYTMQGHLGAMTVNYSEKLRGVPTSRHEAACASGAISTLVARTEIEAGHYDLSMVVGVEMMKSVDSKVGGITSVLLPGTTKKPRASSSRSRNSSAGWAQSTKNSMA
jgi:acetyl-CoA C-acetyltransferase